MKLYNVWIWPVKWHFMFVDREIIPKRDSNITDAKFSLWIAIFT